MKGIIVARFQTPYLHDGHKALIQGVKEKHNQVVVVLGVSPVKASKKNPLDYGTREKLIKECYPDIIVLPLHDHSSDNVWSTNLDTLLNSVFPGEHMILYGSRDSFMSYYSGKLKVEEFPVYGKFNATEIREMVSETIGTSADFRKGVVYATYQQYPKVYPTVDIALFKNERKKMLLGQKTESNLWRFPGGFVDPTDDSYEEAAKRELREEVGDVEVGEFVYEMNQKVDDWRYKGEVDKIITTLFSTDLTYGNAQADDDLAHVQWFDWIEIQELIQNKQIYKGHLNMAKHLVKKYSH